MKIKWKLILHSFAGLFILAGVGALSALSFPGDSFLGGLSRAIVVAQAFVILGGLNLYIMVKTPFRDVISECADVLAEMEEKWRSGKFTAADAGFARAAATEASGRVLAVMLFAGLALAIASFGIVAL